MTPDQHIRLIAQTATETAAETAASIAAVSAAARAAALMQAVPGIAGEGHQSPEEGSAS